MSRIPTTAEKTLLRTTPFRSKLYMVVEKGTSLFTAKVNDPTITEGETVITYDAQSGEDDVLARMTLFNKALDEIGNEKGSARIKSINTGTNKITIEPNSIDWEDNEDLLVDGVLRLYRILPKITSGIVKEDYDKTYTNQNDKDKRKPVALMGSPRYAWTGEQIDFYGWRSYAKARDGTGKRYKISSYAWGFDGGTIVSGAADEAGRPSSPNWVKWNTPGERHVRLKVTDGNGNTHRAYRPVIVVDRPGQGDSPPYEEFEVELLEGDWDSGDWRASITVTGDATPSDFPNNALAILFCEDWYSGTKQSIGGWFGQEDILLCACVIEDSVRQDAETGDVTFEIASIVSQLKEIDVWPLNFKSVDGTPSGWHEFQNMTIEDIFWHIVEEHTTLKNIADVFIWTGVSGGKRIDFVDITEAAVYDQLDQQLLSAIFGHLVSSRYSSVHGNRNFNMLNADQRIQVGRLVMNLEKQDWIDDLEIAGERHRDAVCQVDFIGLIYDANGDPIEVYSLAPENQKNFGRVEKQTGILLTGSTIEEAQDEANELAGLYLAYQNIRFPSIAVKLGNYRIFDPAHQDLVGLAVQPGDTPRGYDWYDPQTGRAKELIVRRVSYEIDHEGGYMTALLGLEASTWGKDGRAGPYPPIPPPDEPDDPPPEPPPPPPTDGKRVIIASYGRGVFVTDDIYASPPVWTALNDGLTGNALEINGLIRDPWDPSNTAFIFTEDGIYKNTDIQNGGSWVQKLSPSELKTLLGSSYTCVVEDLKASICQNGLMFAVASDAEYALFAQLTYIIRTIDGGENWTREARLLNNNVPNWPDHCRIFRAYNATGGGNLRRMGNLYASSHDADKLWVLGVSGWGVAFQDRKTLWGSTDKGTTLPIVNEGPAEDADAAGGVQVGYHDNSGDQRMYISAWTVQGEEHKSIDGGSAKTEIFPPTSVRFKGMIGDHTWNKNLVRAIGEIGGLDSNGELTISEDGASSWSAGIDLGMPVWSAAGFPYDEQLMYFGRAYMPVLGDYPSDPTEPLVKITQDQGATLLDKSGNLRADFDVKSVVTIVPDWLE